MPSRRKFLASTAVSAVSPELTAAPQPPAHTESDRAYWVQMLTRIAEPVLSALSERKLVATMPVEAPHGNVEDRRQFTYLEALGRTLTGIAPWLESGDSDAAEGDLRKRYAEMARQAIAAAVDPASPDRMNFTRGAQPVVDAAFLALGLLRAPSELWQKLDAATRQRVIEGLRSTRVIRPGFNNWLLFSAIVEAFLASVEEQWDEMRVDYAVRQHEQWYKGDGIYGDGPEFHWDYYNSFVIHPMLLAVVETVSRRSKTWDGFHAAIVARAKRYAAIQERLIAPDGSFPAIGRSLPYRCGAFHLLATMALRRELPDGVSPEQVRGALTAAIRRTLDAAGTFQDKGWLNVGFCGHQPSVAESYISTGSLYLCCAAFLPLGLASTDVFWSNAPQPWTSRKIWSGQDIPADHAS